MVLVKILVKVLMSPVGVPEIDAQLWLLPAVLLGGSGGGRSH